VTIVQDRGRSSGHLPVLPRQEAPGSGWHSKRVRNGSEIAQRCEKLDVQPSSCFGAIFPLAVAVITPAAGAVDRQPPTGRAAWSRSAVAPPRPNLSVTDKILTDPDIVQH